MKRQAMMIKCDFCGEPLLVFKRTFEAVKADAENQGWYVSRPTDLCKLCAAKINTRPERGMGNETGK